MRRTAAYFWDVVKKHQTVISEPLLGKTRGEPVVQVAAPILTLDDSWWACSWA